MIEVVQVPIAKLERDDAAALSSGSSRIGVLG
jgi:hypothetical protein